MKGNYRKATEEYINLLLETIEVEPEKWGLFKDKLAEYLRIAKESPALLQV
jgi:hypothetical protein